MENLKRIARVSKSDGTEGAVIISFLSADPEELEISEPVFVFFDGLPVPFFIESLVRKGVNKAVIRLTDIRSFADAEELVGKEVYVEDGDECGYDDDLTGWTVLVAGNLDGDGKDRHGRKGEGLKEDAAEKTVTLGKVTDFLDIPGNPCIEVTPDGDGGAAAPGTKKGAVIVPLHEDLIVSVDPKARTITMSLPAGLF